MSNLLAFAGSNSSTSINFQLVKHTVSLIEGTETQLLNMANYPFPMYSMDYEKEKGFSNSLIELKNDIVQAKGLIISVNEHNGGLSAYFKNLLDWLSRLDIKFLQDQKVFLMATSPGKRGGLTALEFAAQLLPRFGAIVVATYSLPSFGHSFTAAQGITDTEQAAKHKEALAQFMAQI